MSCPPEPTPGIEPGSSPYQRLPRTRRTRGHCDRCADAAASRFSDLVEMLGNAPSRPACKARQQPSASIPVVLPATASCLIHAPASRRGLRLRFTYGQQRPRDVSNRRRACKESNLVRRIWNPLRDLRSDPRAPRAGFDPASLARQASRDTSRVTRHSRGFAPLPAQVPPILAPASVGRSHEPGPRFGDYLRGRRSRLESDQHDAV